MNIWNNSQIVTECVYTDNPKVDESYIQKAFYEANQNRDKLKILTVLLDIFHAKSRVVKEISRSHPDKKSAIADLSSIFGKLHHFNSYDTKSKLSEALNNWCNKYKIVHNQLSLSFEEKISLIGIYNILVIDFVVVESNQKKNKSSFKNKKKQISELKSIITPEVEHQIDLLTSEPNLSSLWNIKFFSRYGNFFI